MRLGEESADKEKKATTSIFKVRHVLLKFSD